MLTEEQIALYRGKLKDEKYMTAAIERIATDFSMSADVANGITNRIAEKKEKPSADMKNKLSDLNNALFAELEALQDTDSFKTEDGEIDGAKVEFAIKKANAVSNVAAQIMKVNQLQLDVARTAAEMGYKVEMPEALIGRPDGNKRAALEAKK